MFDVQTEVIEEDVWIVNRVNQYALNIVIFQPKDLVTEEGMIDQVSSVMLFAQIWFEKQMELQGYGKKTFGLITNQYNKVKIDIITGKQESAFYLDNHSEVNKEVKSYFEIHPDKKWSDHTFVLGKNGSGVPFYGLGKSAFATSNDFKLRSTGKYVGDLELMVCDKLGGIMHELAHGLNLPHCAHKASDLPKISLMSFGNHTYQKIEKSDLVFLTPSDCAILNVSQTFNKTDQLYYQSNPSPKIKTYKVEKDDLKQTTKIEGVLTSMIKANHIYIGHNGYPLEGGYDRITFTVPLSAMANTNEYAFSLEMPYADIFNGYQAKDLIELSLVVVLENGKTKTLDKYDYTINPGVIEPNDDILRDYKSFVFSDRSNWTISSNTSSSNSSASLMLDGDIDTYWHSLWPYSISERGAHLINIDMQQPQMINGIYLKSDRQGGQFRPKHLIVETSTDGITWTKSKEITIASLGNAREVLLYFDKSTFTRYIKLNIDEIFASNSSEENLIISELDILNNL